MNAVTRVITKQLAGEEDITFGTGTVTQSRGGSDRTITKVDKIHPVGNVSILQGDTIDPLKFGKLMLLCHTVSNDNGGGLIYWDPTDTTSTDDNGTIFVSTFSGASGRWKRLFTGPKNVKMFGGSGDGVTEVTSNLASLSSDINTKGKQTGVMYFNTTTGLPVWAAGSTPSSVWVDATGATAHTPV